MISLQEIDQNNFQECIELERKSHKYVGDATYVLAEAYTYRHNSNAYGIYEDDTIIGLVILRDRPRNQDYSFTDLFIADPFQSRGFGKLAVEEIIKKFEKEGKADRVEIYVHNTNDTAIRLYMKVGFVEAGKAAWDEEFVRFYYQIQ
ncbi:MAG: GNAT family N-acetyltransferase [Christensenellales bacterium]|jgi:diamine N-acetyltransferase